MKKIIVSISLLCYFVVTCGVIINSHYCRNRLASVHLFETSVDVCGRCGMDTHESNGCCRDEVKVVKLVQDQTQTDIVSYDIPSLETIVSIPSNFLVTSSYNVDEKRHFHNHSPPRLSAQDTYLQINVFRI
jgi:hypothetical protein